MTVESTTFFLSPFNAAAPEQEARHHCLVEIVASGPSPRHRVPSTGLSIGRLPPADLIVPDSAVSRSHCRIVLCAERLLLTDTGSTNGTFLDGERVDGTAIVPVGGVIRIGSRCFRYEVLAETELLRAEELDRDLEIALGYVRALLPPPRLDGPVLVDWHFEPSVRLGGDAFGFESLEGGHMLIYLIDVSGHGAGAALHAVAIVNLLRQGALGVDSADPAAVLAALDRRFPMEDHADMFFTIWYGVFDPVSRELHHAAAGHHAAILCVEGRPSQAIGTRNRMIGAVMGRPFQADRTIVPPNASLYVFSDGVFEIDSLDGRWTLANFTPLLPAGSVTGVPASIYQTVKACLRTSAFEDDFSLLGITFTETRDKEGADAVRV